MPGETALSSVGSLVVPVGLISRRSPVRIRPLPLALGETRRKRPRTGLPPRPVRGLRYQCP